MIYFLNKTLGQTHRWFITHSKKQPEQYLSTHSPCPSLHKVTEWAPDVYLTCIRFTSQEQNPERVRLGTSLGWLALSPAHRCHSPAKRKGLLLYNVNHLLPGRWRRDRMTTLERKPMPLEERKGTLLTWKSLESSVFREILPLASKACSQGHPCTRNAQAMQKDWEIQGKLSPNVIIFSLRLIHVFA